MKHWRLLLYQITIGLSIRAIAALAKNTIVKRYFDFLPPFPCFFSWTKPVSGGALKNSLTRPYSKYCLMNSLPSILAVFQSKRRLFLQKHLHFHKRFHALLLRKLLSICQAIHLKQQTIKLALLEQVFNFHTLIFFI